MALFAVSLIFTLRVDASIPPEATRELAIHVVAAESKDVARERGVEIGRARQTAYLNRDGETVRDAFQGVVEVQTLLDQHFFDGMEVSCWLYKGQRLVLEEGWDQPPLDVRDGAVAT